MGEFLTLSKISSVFSILGFFVTCFLLWEARKIRNSFLKKARVPEIAEDLDKVAKELFVHLENFKNESRNINEKVQKSVGLLESVLPKINEGEKEKIDDFIKISKILDNDFTEDNCWNVYSKLSGLVAYLKELAKDTRWD